MALAQIINHAARAVARLASQFAESPLMKGLVTAIANEVQLAEDAIFPVLAVRDIDAATSKTLDNIGLLTGTPARGSKTDTVYRRRIRAQILGNKSSGSMPTVYEIAKLVMADWWNPAAIKIEEDPSGAPGYLVLENLFDVNDTADAKDLGRILDDVSPAGVHAIVLSQTQSPATSFSFENGPGLGFGDGKFVGAYDGGKKS